MNKYSSPLVFVPAFAAVVKVSFNLSLGDARGKNVSAILRVMQPHSGGSQRKAGARRSWGAGDTYRLVGGRTWYA